MARKYFVPTILPMILTVFLFSGCSSNSTEISSIPDPSIVWADDFEDGDIDGWKEDNPGSYYVNEGVLTSGPEIPDPLRHESKVSVGTWSFDLNFNQYSYYVLCISCEQDFRNGFGISTGRQDNTVVVISTLSEYTLSESVASVDLGRKLSGWNHFDVTRDDSGNSRVYLNGELILEYKDELTFSPQMFMFDVEEVGHEFDNLVVRNKVLDIQP